ncbi:AMP-binding protein [Mycobacterium sp. 236(2023)]|uniref:AMP-binding protein n=1 Tax=Mycobacterium sp. 236(2023) TaxID=3038163 RepID=UPI0024153F78|nr:AMP-binding protein [Mycobacterium sp. 236(2023)]MDG4669216.1 AMP-binding protein [Mycobacterium sp. 236(2023)]
MDLCNHVGAGKAAVILHPSGRSVTFKALDESANRLANYLRRRGIDSGDTIAVLMENNEHIHAVMWAARRSGLYFTLVNTHLTASEAAYVVNDSGAKAIISSRAMADVCVEMVRHLPHGLPSVALVANGDMTGWQNYPECAEGESIQFTPDESEGQLLQYSAGSTGRPKGIRRPRISGSAGRSSLPTPVFEALGVARDSVYLSPAPTYHTAPAMWTMSAQAVGATTVMMERFDALQALRCIERYGVTHAQFVPTMFVRMLRLSRREKQQFDLSSLRRVIHAAAPCPPAIKHQMIEWWGPIIDEYYGSSEGAGISLISAEEWLRRPGSVGKPILGQPHILDENLKELPPRQIGDVYFDGGYSFEYLNDAEKTAGSRSPQGWVTVGDIGFVDEEGYLFLTDRRHNMIISGGVNVYPQEVENVLISHPLVADVAVFGVHDDDLGQSVIAVVELAQPALASEATNAELMSWASYRLARHKRPRSIVFTENMPRTDAGKLYKDRLILEYMASGESCR